VSEEYKYQLYAFNNFTEFFDFLNGKKGQAFSSPPYANFKKCCKNINVGCKCKKKERLAKARQAYTTILNTLPDGVASELRRIIGAKEIEFYMDGNLYLKI
jgi:hypothetical protein